MKEGRIIKALSGFYYIYADGNIYACRGRGLFRNKKITPLVGDFARFKVTNENEGYILDILERENQLIRPPIANVTQAVIVHSITEPNFSAQLLDRFLVIVAAKRISPMIVLSKYDLATDSEIEEVDRYKKDYEMLGYPVTYFSLSDERKPESIIEFLRDEVTVFMGQSGVGKSTILNAIDPSLAIKTGEISRSLGRGKHTTRHVELHRINGGLVADTPGFSSIELENIEADELSNCFVEINEYGAYCNFRSCLHVKEPKCAVKKAVEDGEIRSYRYEHYRLFLQEILSRKPRY